MSKMESSPSLWAPRHSGWRLAHHLLASFVLLAFLAGSGTYALLSQKSVLATGLLASALAVLLGVVAAFRRSPADRAVVNMAVLTSSGPRAATWFPMFRTSAKGAAAIMGLSVVILVATVSLSARLLLIHNYEPRGLVLVLTALLLAIGVFVLNRGIRMARLAVTAQEPGVYLTRSRIVIHSSRGTREIYWNDVADIEAADPPRRKPLGKRGPAWVLVLPHAQNDGTSKPLVITVHELAANPDQLYRAFNHYAAHADDRAELGTEEALARLQGLLPEV
ncbi:hypothetical protein [Paeniglutamicibacter sp. Y32M11]|uniref:hypothetical protein n=1 Tax=Paeniglutamicibacter sp. Y32M11 TaxID=2853258 RepID=UPI001C532AEB|nr:hypothetical protein [Paeniglutamicibacter sp. Y32M11]QXQ09772.1 hypothetical protein KUF55_15165 [Paeniglutamicibacter sp. Y32M11]